MLRLDGGGETLLISLGEGPPALTYWGPHLPADRDVRQIGFLAQRAVPHGMLDGGEVLDLCPEAARGFNGHPAIEVHRPSGAFLTQLAFVASREIPEGHEIRSADPLAGIELVQTVTLDADTGVAAFRSRLTNSGDEPLCVDWLAPAALPMAHDEVMVFDGRWAREFQPVRQRLATRPAGEGEPHRPHPAPCGCSIRPGRPIRA
jgi:alpha-galactosidase